MDAQGEILKPGEIKGPKPTSLSPLEQYLTGGTPSKSKVSLQDIEEILQRSAEEENMGDEDASRLLTPVAFAGKDITLEMLGAIRLDRLNKKIKSSFVAYKNGRPVKAVLGLSAVGNSGKIKPEWGVQFLDEHGSLIDISQVRLNESLQKLFVLSETQANKAVLRFKPVSV